MQDVQIANKYTIQKKIGSGSFGEIFQAANTETSEQVAVKLENASARHPQLLYEGKVMKFLEHGKGIPSIYYSGTEGSFNVLVMELLGPSLEDLFNNCNRLFCMKTVLLIAQQMLDRIWYIHSKSFIHRDIKPDNFLIGAGKQSSLLYIIDFGLAKRYKDSKTNTHIPYREGKSLTGTARYASINTHLGIEQSRRDDLEGIGYVLMYFLRGSLPWQGINTRQREDKYRKIGEIKVETRVEELCENFPEEFCHYLNYCRALKFEDQPDYEYLLRMFKDLFFRLGFELDFDFDWVVRKSAQRRTAPIGEDARRDKEKKKSLKEKKKKKSCRII